MNDNLPQITPHPTRKELGFVVIFVSCHSFFLSVEAFLRKVSYFIMGGLMQKYDQIKDT
jgi:hypothetical protein